MDETSGTEASSTGGDDEATAGACVGGAPSLETLNWSFNGAAFFMLATMTTIGYGVHAPMHMRPCICTCTHDVRMPSCLPHDDHRILQNSAPMHMHMHS